MEPKKNFLQKYWSQYFFLKCKKYWSQIFPDFFGEMSKFLEPLNGNLNLNIIGERSAPVNFLTFDKLDLLEATQGGGVAHLEFWIFFWIGPFFSKFIQKSVNLVQIFQKSLNHVQIFQKSVNLVQDRSTNHDFFSDFYFRKYFKILKNFLPNGIILGQN